MVPFSETTILELERTQNQVAKYALGVTLSTAGVCAQVELGFKPVRQLLYEHQLKFYARLLQLDSGRWAKQAFLDHQSGTWSSPYLAHIRSIRSRIGLYELPLSQDRLLRFTMKYFVDATNTALASLSLPWLPPISKFRRQLYVKECEASVTLAQFRYNVAHIGNKFPRVGRLNTSRDCPLCPCPTLNSVSHLALFCPAIELVRREHTGLASFRNICVFKGFSEAYTFQLLVNGLDWNENPVDQKDFLKTGQELKILMDSWLAKW